MSVCVAAFTGLRSLLELLTGYPCVIFPEMAIAARFPLVRPGKPEIGFLMVKGNSCPPGFIMTVLTSRFRVIFFADQSLVQVCMTINTTLADFPEFPDGIIFSCPFDMAENAGNGEMGSFQPESAFIVLFKGEIEICKAFHSVALGTIG